jgi:hypothetical protein
MPSVVNRDCLDLACFRDQRTLGFECGNQLLGCRNRGIDGTRTRDLSDRVLPAIFEQFALNNRAVRLKFNKNRPRFRKGS